ncbi:MAG: FAD:protein FMN transferase [Negativicutes bacterium]|nr:FAD:protein FMN transferase [Negativicutes bacterium]
MSFRNLRAFIGLIVIIFAVTGCAPSAWFAPKPYKETQFLMDTIIEITAYGPNAEPAVKAAFAEFKRLHELTNNFDPNSQVSRVNQLAGREKVKVDPDVLTMIKRSNELSDQLDGVFDVTIGPLVELWGIGRKGEFVPSQAEIDRLLPLVNYHLMELDPAAGTIYLSKAGMLIDLGGIAKGYATDKAVDILKAKGITSALVNAGGDVRVIGKRPDGNPWRIGVQHPRQPAGVIAKMAMTDWDTLETSGDYQRYITSNGVQYSHILDPRTGRQPKGLASVTMVINSSTDGDILSTALFVLGPERALEALKRFPGVEAIMVTPDGKVTTSPGLEGKIEITAE